MRWGPQARIGARWGGKNGIIMIFFIKMSATCTHDAEEVDDLKLRESDDQATHIQQNNPGIGVSCITIQTGIAKGF